MSFRDRIEWTTRHEKGHSAHHSVHFNSHTRVEQHTTEQNQRRQISKIINPHHLMSASPPFIIDRVRDSLSALQVCQEDPFGGEFKLVDAELIRQLDPFIAQCLEYVNLPSKKAKTYKIYNTDKGRFLGLSARARHQKSDGCLELSLREQITILFIMALYRTDKEGSSETVADPIESCSGDVRGEYDSPLANTPDYIMNRHGSNTENLLEKIQEKISLIKDNLNKYFARDYDYDKDVFVYKNCLLKGYIDYTNDAEFTKLISHMSTKTKTVSEGKNLPVKPKGRTMPAKRRRTISQCADRMTAPHLASAEQCQIRESHAATVDANPIEYASYTQYSTPVYDHDYPMNLSQAPEAAQVGNFPTFPVLDPAEETILSVAYQGSPGAVALFHSAPDGIQLFNCLKKLHEMFESFTGCRYLDLLNEQSQSQALMTQAALAYSALSATNAPVAQAQVMPADPQQMQVPYPYQQGIDHDGNYHQPSEIG